MNKVTTMTKAEWRETIAADLEKFLSDPRNSTERVPQRKAPKLLRNIFITNRVLTKDGHYPVSDHKSIPLAA